MQFKDRRTLYLFTSVIHPVRPSPRIQMVKKRLQRPRPEQPSLLPEQKRPRTTSPRSQPKPTSRPKWTGPRQKPTRSRPRQKTRKRYPMAPTQKIHTGTKTSPISSRRLWLVVSRSQNHHTYLGRLSLLPLFIREFITSPIIPILLIPHPVGNRIVGSKPIDLDTETSLSRIPLGRASLLNFFTARLY